MNNLESIISDVELNDLPQDKKLKLIQEFLFNKGAKFSHFGNVQLPGITMKLNRLFVDKTIANELYDYVPVIELFLNCEVVFVNNL